MTSHSKGILIALAGTTVWATTGIFISYLLKHYDLQPLTLAFWRDLIIALALLLILRLWQPQALKISRRDLPFFVVYGFFGLAIFNSLWTFSVQFNGAAVATVLAYSSPAFTVLLAWPVLKEAITSRKLVAVGLSLAGCVFVAKAYSAEAWQVNPVGILVGLGTGLAFAFYNLAGRWSGKRFVSPWTVTAYGFLFAAIGLSLTQRPDTLFTMKAWDGWTILIILAVGPSLMGFGFYTLSLRYLQASVASLIATLEPALTAIMAIFLLGETLNEKQWLGAALILAAVILVQTGPVEGVKRETTGDKRQVSFDV
ncbi:MAG: EamA family transporter [Chloroflexi bacterium]|nr:EamA family transporter [Chloroflexota bacterium]